MHRKPLGIGHNAVREAVRVLGPARLALRPAALLGVLLGRFGLGFGLHTPQQGANVDFISTMRALHKALRIPTDSYES